MKIQQLTENMVHAATALGFAAVEDIAKKALAAHPNMSLWDFLAVLQQYKMQVSASVQVKQQD